MRSCAIIGALVVLAIGAISASASQQAAGPSYKVAGMWGKSGTANGEFRNPLGIATDKAGFVYVADTDNRRIQVFTRSGGFVRKWGSIGSGNGQFTNVQDVAIGPDGSVWAADLKANRAQQFSNSGNFQTSVGTPKEIWGVAVDGDGNVYASTAGDNISAVVRFDKTPTGYSGARTIVSGGFAATGDVESSPDGSIYAADNRAHVVKRYDSSGRLLKTIKAGVASPHGIGVDLDCNVWVTNIAVRRLDHFSPQGKLLGTAASPDLIAQDVAAGPKGDLYAIDNATRIVRFAEDKSKPVTAGVPGTIAVVKGVAKVKFALPGVACPAQVAAVATLKGKGVSGKASVKVAAGKTTTITLPVKAPRGKTTAATFTIVLKTNGRPTTQTKSVKVKA